MRLWSESWKPPETRLEALHDALSEVGAQVDLGGEFERWDLRVRGGLAGSARLLIAQEDHAGGRQLVRVLIYPTASPVVYVLAGTFALLAVVAAVSSAWVATSMLAAIAAVIVMRFSLDQAAALGAATRAIDTWAERQPLVHLPSTDRQAAV
jgi:hypothetical protein